MTAARPTNNDMAARFYTKEGVPVIEVPKKSGTGTKKPTVVDARIMGLFPSVTSVLRVLDKPQLNDWKIEQACLAVLTTPRKDGEDVDAFVKRVFLERIHDEEARAAREKGSEIHDAIALALTGQEYDPHMLPFVAPVLAWQRGVGRVIWTEKVLVGDGYAGQADCLLDNDTLKVLVLPDFKTTKNIPKESYLEHKLQTSAYAAALGNTDGKRIITCNVYISTANPGEIVCRSQDDWAKTYVRGFEPVLHYWQFANGMIP